MRAPQPRVSACAATRPDTATARVPCRRTNLPQLCADGRDLMRKMLKMEPTQRIAAADAICHPYFDGLHEQCEVVAHYLPQSMPLPTDFLQVRARAAARLDRRAPW